MDRALIGLVAFPGVQLLDIAGPLEVFNGVDGLEARVLAVETKPVAPVGLQNVTIVPDATLRETEHVDVLLVPGGEGIRTLLRDPNTLREITRLGESAQFVTSVCTGALVLGAAGLLRGYRAATHWNYADLLPLVGATPSDARVERDRNRITSGGVTAGIDFGLFLLAQLYGEHTAQRQQLNMQYDPQPPFSAGTPKSAPAHVVAEIREATRHIYEERKRLLTGPSTLR